MSWENFVNNNYKNLFFITIALLIFSCKQNRPATDAYGNFEAIELSVSSEIQGKIIDLLIEEGQELSKGQIVGYLDSLPYYYKKQQLIAQVQVAEAKLFQISDQVGLLHEQINMMDSDINRIKNQDNEGSFPLKQLNELNGQKRLLHKQIIAKEHERITISSEIRSLSFQIAEIQNQLEKCAIINPAEGTVIEKFAEIGEIAIPGKPLYKIADLTYLKLRTLVNGEQISRIKMEDRVKVYVKIDKYKERSYNGIISWIASEAEKPKKKYQAKEEKNNLVYAIKIDVKNDGYLKIGMPAEIVFLKK
jgi:HlyD family secretion protein